MEACKPGYYICDECGDEEAALHTAGDALAAVANWARERLPAAAEKEHGG